MIDEIRDAAADIALEVFGEFGETFTFQNTRTSPVLTLIGDVGDENTTSEDVLSGGDEDAGVKTFFGPRTADFPPAAGILQGAVFTHNSKKYVVQESNDGGAGAVFRVPAKCSRARRLRMK